MSNLKVMLNGEERNLGYTVENNLTPTVEEALTILKKMCYSGDVRRNENNSYVAKSILDNMLYYHLSPGMFENGHIELKDDNNNIVSRVDLFKPYSGSDARRGSINLNESYRYCIEEKIIARISVDFPTHSSNGSIKYVEFYSKPAYETVAKKTDIRETTKKILYSGYDNVRICFDDDDNMFLFSSSDKIIKDLTRNKTYKMTSSFSNAHINYFRNNFWTVTELSTDVAASYMTLKKLIFNEETLEVSLSNDPEIRISPIPGSGPLYKRYLQFIRDYNGKTYIGTVYDNDDGVSIATLENDNTVTNIKILYVAPALGGTAYQIASFKPDNEGFIYLSGINSSSNVRYNLNTCNVEKTSNTPKHARFKEGKTFYYNNITYIRHSSKYGPTDSGTPDVFLDQMQENFKIPLRITMTEPLIKTSEQTMKLILDIEIE